MSLSFGRAFFIVCCFFILDTLCIPFFVGFQGILPVGGWGFGRIGDWGCGFCDQHGGLVGCVNLCFSSF